MIKPVVITSGDMNGIGPEVALKAVSTAPEFPVILSGPESVFSFYNQRLDHPVHWKKIAHPSEASGKGMFLIEPDSLRDHNIEVEPGKVIVEAGKCAMLSIDDAISWCSAGLTSALVTAPINKESVNLAGYAIPGHTEYLAEKTGTGEVVMMLATESLRVIPLTTHIPVSEIKSALNADLIRKKVLICDASLKSQFGISDPRIAVLGLNPHAGDGGVIGRDEIELINPVIDELQNSGINCDGPYPADGLFASGGYRRFDAIIGMYHDQVLIPFKMLSDGGGVNTTLGLPIIRTSPDHGTAFDIAGRNIADASSMKSAIRLAGHLAEKASALT